MRQYLCIAAVIAAALGAAGCDENLSTLAGPTPDLEPTFASIQRDIFEATDTAGRSSCVSCHNSVGSPFTGGLNLQHDVAYDQLVNAASSQKPAILRVAPGDPGASYLVHKLEGAPGIVGFRMPRNGPPYLTSGQMTILRRWIEIGAPRN
jgi:hypothetical protein